MSYYKTIDEDLQRAKEILEKGKPAPWETANFSPEVIEAFRQGGLGTIYGADVYAAYKLLESFVAEIERLRWEVEQLNRLRQEQRNADADRAKWIDSDR